MPALLSYEYAIIRVVPHVERGEFLNAGVILSCRERRFLAARLALDRARLLALAPECDCEEIERHLEGIPLLCEGDQQAGALATLSQTERFHWLVAPRSTVIQISAVHSGRCAEPAVELEKLLSQVVRGVRVS